MPEKKDYVNVRKEVHKQKLYNLEELYSAWKEKCNYWVFKVLCQRPKWCVLAGSKMTHFVCV